MVAAASVEAAELAVHLPKVIAIGVVRRLLLGHGVTGQGREVVGRVVLPHEE